MANFGILRDMSILFGSEPQRPSKNWKKSPTLSQEIYYFRTVLLA